MNTEFLLIVLFLATVSAILVFAVAGKWKIERRSNGDKDHRKSSLAADGPIARR